MEGEDASEIKKLNEELTNASHSLAQTMYQQSEQADNAQAGFNTQQGDAYSSHGSSDDDDVIDAEYQEAV